MDFKIAAANLEFPEGPIAMRDGSVLLVEIGRATLTRISAQGDIDIVAHLGGGPNGAAIGPDGAVYICNNGGMTFARGTDGTMFAHGVPQDYKGGSIQRVDLETGASTTLYEACGGQRLRGPNDLVFDGAGGFWFTDMGKATDKTIDKGALYYALPDGSSITRIDVPLITPNGVGLSVDEKNLWVAETLTSRLWSIELSGPGRLARPVSMLTPPHVLGPLPGLQMFDSLALEADGRVCVATPLKGAITIFATDGTFEQIELPDLIPTNIAFGGADGRTAWITAGGTGRLLRAEWPRAGAPLAFG